MSKVRHQSPGCGVPDASLRRGEIRGVEAMQHRGLEKRPGFTLAVSAGCRFRGGSTNPFGSQWKSAGHAGNLRNAAVATPDRGRGSRMAAGEPEFSVSAD